GAVRRCGVRPAKRIGRGWLRHRPVRAARPGALRVADGCGRRPVRSAARRAATRARRTPGRRGAALSAWARRGRAGERRFKTREVCMETTKGMGRTENFLRKLHSLSGLIPIGVFLTVHTLVNSSAIWGEEAYNV